MTLDDVADAYLTLHSLVHNPQEWMDAIAENRMPDRFAHFVPKAPMTVEQIAQLAHETNRAYCAMLGDTSQVPWADAPEWQRSSAVLGVEFHLKNPNASNAASHESWLAEKERDGWTYGSVKDAEKKEHPCYVPFEQLPRSQQLKDALFRAIVRACTSIPGVDIPA